MSTDQKFIQNILLVWQLEYTVENKNPHFWSKKLLTVLRLDMCPWLRLDLAIQTAKFVEKYEAKS